MSGPGPIGDNPPFSLERDAPHVKKVMGTTLPDLLGKFSGLFTALNGVAADAKAAEFNKQVAAECEGLEKKLKGLIARIMAITDFVNGKADLKAACEAHMKTDQFVVCPDDIALPIDDKDPIQRRTALQLRINRSECHLTEFEEFVERNEAVMKCFLKYIKAASKDERALLALPEPSS